MTFLTANQLQSYMKAVQKGLPHIISLPLTKLEKCSFEGLKSGVSPTCIPSFESFQQIAEL
jgi:hypothetical protein